MDAIDSQLGINHIAITDTFLRDIRALFEESKLEMKSMRENFGYANSQYVKESVLWKCHIVESNGKIREKRPDFPTTYSQYLEMLEKAPNIPTFPQFRCFFLMMRSRK